jgi:hypothetical protein
MRLGPEDNEWAVRGEMDDDGTVRLLPLYPDDVPAFVEAAWDEPLPDVWGWSLRPTTR